MAGRPPHPRVPKCKPAPKRRGRIPDEGKGVLTAWLLAVVIAFSHHPAQPTRTLATHHRWRVVPAAFITQALCVHDGWHYRLARRGDQTVYVFRGQRFARTWKTWSNGEGGWHTVNGYAGGLQFLLSTWNRAGRPYAGSLGEAASKPPYEQIRRAWIIVRQDGGSWREWPRTSRACGLR